MVISTLTGIKNKNKTSIKENEGTQENKIHKRHNQNALKSTQESETLFRKTAFSTCSQKAFL